MSASDLFADDGITPSHRLALQIGIIARQMRVAFDKRVGEIGITRSQWALIVVASRHPGANQRVIAEALEMSEASAGRLIDRLCAEGMLERRAREGDRRARSIYVSEKAMALVSKLSALAESTEKDAFQGLSEEEIEALTKSLDIIYRNVSPRWPLACDDKIEDTQG